MLRIRIQFALHTEIPRQMKVCKYNVLCASLQIPFYQAAVWDGNVFGLLPLLHVEQRQYVTMLLMCTAFRMLYTYSRGYA